MRLDPLSRSAAEQAALVREGRLSARELSGASGMLFRRNSQSGAIEVVQRSGDWGGLNAALHVNR